MNPYQSITKYSYMIGSSRSNSEYQFHFQQERTNKSPKRQTFYPRVGIEKRKILWKHIRVNRKQINKLIAK